LSSKLNTEDKPIQWCGHVKRINTARMLRRASELIFKGRGPMRSPAQDGSARYWKTPRRDRGFLIHQLV
jgi:hypothetical protein